MRSQVPAHESADALGAMSWRSASIRGPRRCLCRSPPYRASWQIAELEATRRRLIKNQLRCGRLAGAKSELGSKAQQSRQADIDCFDDDKCVRTNGEGTERHRWFERSK